MKKLDLLLSRREADGVARLEAAKDEWRRRGFRVTAAIWRAYRWG